MYSPFEKSLFLVSAYFGVGVYFGKFDRLKAENVLKQWQNTRKLNTVKANLFQLKNPVVDIFLLRWIEEQREKMVRLPFCGQFQHFDVKNWMVNWWNLRNTSKKRNRWNQTYRQENDSRLETNRTSNHAKTPGRNTRQKHQAKTPGRDTRQKHQAKTPGKNTRRTLKMRKIKSLTVISGNSCSRSDL